MVRGCSLIDSRLDTAKICSDGRVHVDHAQLPAVFGEKKRFHTAWTRSRSRRPRRSEPLTRTPACESGGQEFEPLWAPLHRSSDGKGHIGQVRYLRLQRGSSARISPVSNGWVRAANHSARAAARRRPRSSIGSFKISSNA